MSEHVEVLGLGLLVASGEGPHEPEAVTVGGGARTASPPSPYVENFLLWDTVSVWRHRSDVVRLVIGLGTVWAERAAYVGTDADRLVEQRTLFDELARAVGAPLRHELQAAVSWFARVRDGDDVGLWIQVWATPNRFAPYSFTIVAVEPRAHGSVAPPWS